MRAFWHPVSAIYIDEPRMLASPAVVRLVLAGEGRASIVYAGDRMWPAIRHGQSLVVAPVTGAAPAEGDVVLVVDGGVPDLTRVRGGQGRACVADADLDPPRPIPPGSVLGRLAPGPRRRAPSGRLARTVLDLLEAAAHRPDPDPDPADTVRSKYDGQAVHYQRSDADALDSRLGARIAARVARGGRILVAGSGAGREAFALEAMGYEVAGVDFSERMVASARAEASRRGSKAQFFAADLRSYDDAEGSLAAVVFTYDVYSFVPGTDARRALLARVRRWLAPGGAVFLSARRAQGAWDRAVLTLQWAAAAARGRPVAWGDSHTRWLDASGAFRRSYVHVFTESGLAAETSACGFRKLSWDGGHGLYA